MEAKQEMISPSLGDPMPRRLDEAQAVPKKRNGRQDALEDRPWGHANPSDTGPSAYVSREEMEERQGQLVKMINEMRGVKREASEELEESHVRTSRRRASPFPGPLPVDRNRPRYGSVPRLTHRSQQYRNRPIGRIPEITHNRYQQQPINSPSLPHKPLREMHTLREVEDFLALINLQIRTEGLRHPFPRPEEIVRLHREREQALQRRIGIDYARPAVSNAHQIQREMLVTGKPAPFAPMAVGQEMLPPPTAGQATAPPRAMQGILPPPLPPTAAPAAAKATTPLVVEIVSHFQHLKGRLEDLEGAFQPRGKRKGEAMEIGNELMGHAKELLARTQSVAGVLVKKEDEGSAVEEGRGGYGAGQGQVAASGIGSQRGVRLPARLPPGTPRGPMGRRRVTAADMMGDGGHAASRDVEMSDGVWRMRL